MTIKTDLTNLLLGFLLASFLLACQDNSSSERTKFGIFEVTSDTTILMNGDIGSSSLKHFEELIRKNPKVKLININEVPGSTDDETNLKLSKKVYDLKISTHILDNGLIASGGVDFFLAGSERSIGDNVRIGVHSWGGIDDQGNKVSATDFPEGHEYHQPYIDYYISIGFSQEEARSFYYFTIFAAPPEDIHWMTNDEIEKYKILKS